MAEPKYYTPPDIINAYLNLDVRFLCKDLETKQIDSKGFKPIYLEPPYEA